MRISREEVEWNRKLPSITITLHSFTDEAKDSQEAHFVYKEFFLGCGVGLKVVVDEETLGRACKVCRVINLLNLEWLHQEAVKFP